MWNCAKCGSRLRCAREKTSAVTAKELEPNAYLRSRNPSAKRNTTIGNAANTSAAAAVFKPG